MTSMTAVRRPVGILLVMALTLAVWFIPVAASAYRGSPSLEQRIDRQQISDLREDAAAARRNAKVAFWTAVGVAALGVIVTVATGGAAAPAAAAAVFGLLAGGAGVAELTSATAYDRKADYLTKSYRAKYGEDPR